jgi:hypothetical protein
MTGEQRRDADMFRIAEAFEEAVDVLRKIEAHLSQIAHKP